jgi:hypothetical protein
VYWGGDNILDYLPSECFVDRRLFSSTKAVHEFLLSVSDEEYDNYQKSIMSFLSGLQADRFRSSSVIQNIVNCIIDNLNIEYI